MSTWTYHNISLYIYIVYVYIYITEYDKSASNQNPSLSKAKLRSTDNWWFPTTSFGWRMAFAMCSHDVYIQMEPCILEGPCSPTSSNLFLYIASSNCTMQYVKELAMHGSISKSSSGGSLRGFAQKTQCCSTFLGFVWHSWASFLQRVHVCGWMRFLQIFLWGRAYQALHL